jgi:hypothetical protein
MFNPNFFLIVSFFSGCATSCIMVYLCCNVSRSNVGNDTLEEIALRLHLRDLDLDSPVETRATVRPSAPPQADVYPVDEEESNV